MKYFLPYLLLFTLSLFGDSYPTTPKIRARYSAIDPKSVSQNFAFYELYPETNEGEKALRRAWSLLHKDQDERESLSLISQIDIWPMIHLINRNDQELNSLKEGELNLIENLAKDLNNRSLKGRIFSLEQIINLPPDEIDLSRALLLEQYGDDRAKILSYEAMIDLMALQIKARLHEDSTPKEKIHAISRFIFHEMGFRFPPHSLWAKDIDEYTFLPNVIDSRKGVCLGVSILYLSIAQRLGVHLEAITPPGHIYVRYIEENGDHFNIETTARGINVPTDRYMGIETVELEKRTIKEVVGLAFMNQASVFWTKEEYEKAISLYQKAQKYLPGDYLLTELMAFNYLFVGKVKEGNKLLCSLRKKQPKNSLSKDSLLEDYLNGYATVEGIKAIFLPVDETRESILKKQRLLHKIVKKSPKFRAGLLQLASTYMQIGREKEALEILQKYEKVDAHDPVINYYLAVISMERYDYPSSWKYYLRAKKEVDKASHSPKALKELHKALMRSSPL